MSKLPPNVPGIWAEVRHLAQHASKLRIIWIPSHGKYIDSWIPSQGITREDARLLNDEADRHASYWGRHGARNLEGNYAVRRQARVRATALLLESDIRSTANINEFEKWFKRRCPTTSPNRPRHREGLPVQIKMKDTRYNKGQTIVQRARQRLHWTGKNKTGDGTNSMAGHTRKSQFKPKPGRRLIAKRGGAKDKGN